MGTMTKSKTNTNKPSTFTFGWCGGWPNEVDHESCPKSYVTATESANHKPGDTVTCGCDCHKKSVVK